MSTPNDRSDPENAWVQPQRSPHELRALDIALARFARRRTGSARLARLLAWVSAAEREGHACLQLPDEMSESDLREHLRSLSWVGDGREISPVVLRDEKLFLWRNWRHEQRIALSIGQRTSKTLASAPVDSERVQADLDSLYPEPTSLDQRHAVAAALGKRVFVLTGGPGTGKTTTVLRLLLMLQAHAEAVGLPANPLIALAAPTGKAAARLAQALRAGKQGLSESLREARWQSALYGVPEQASTLHRLLAFQPANDRFGRDQRNPLAADVIVVDEASMVDLALMRALLEATPERAMLVLVGDADQLVSVSAGSVLADLVASAQSDPSRRLHQHVRRLTKVWRAGSGLAEVYECLRQGDAEGLRAALASPEQSACSWHACNDAPQLQRRLDHWLESTDVLENIETLTQSTDPLQALALSRQQQLLCALREGPFGVSTINAQIDARLRQAVGGGSLWYPGRRVIVTRNDYNRRLFNGDIGVALVSDGRLRLHFEALDEQGRATTRALLPQELPEHELAFAITVHKSQGSEYEHVVVVLPADPEHPILSRQLLYTAVSRARQSAQLWTGSEAIFAALRRLVVRHGGLMEALAANSFDLDGSGQS